MPDFEPCHASDKHWVRFFDLRRKELLTREVGFPPAWLQPGESKASCRVLIYIRKRWGC